MIASSIMPFGLTLEGIPRLVARQGWVVISPSMDDKGFCEKEVPHGEVR